MLASLRAILLAAAALFVGAGAAGAMGLPTDSDGNGGRDRVGFADKGPDAPLTAVSFRDGDLEDHGLGKGKNGFEKKNKKRGKGKDVGRDDADGKDFAKKHRKHKNGRKDRDDDDKDFDRDDFDKKHFKDKKKKDDGPVVPEPSLGLLLAASLLALGLRARKR